MFYDRKNELNILSRILRQSVKSACFTALVGRRRIGKTSLLIESFRNEKFLYFFVSRKNEQLLCSQFQKEAQESIGLKIYGTITEFRVLFEQLMIYATQEHFTLIIDEFQELERVNKSIFSDIQDLWDRYHRNAKINFIACGSIYSMMKKIFEDQKEPLFGRLTSKMILRPFDTGTLKTILQHYNPDYNAEDLLCLYMISGGVPKYVMLLMEGGATSKESMIDFITLPDSPFLGEGKDLLVSEFGKEYGTYFSILLLIASGKNTQSEIDSIIEKNTGAYLANLENEYSVIKRNNPIFSKPESRNIRWKLNDNFLMFWFRFIYPNQFMLELGRYDRLKAYILNNYDQFSGLILERYFFDKISEEESITEIGRYWDKKGLNEIDIVAIDKLSKRGIIGEVKRNKSKIDIPALKEKANALGKELSEYQLEFKALSLEDM